jgi:uncharacterized protein (DUF1778 family)
MARPARSEEAAKPYTLRLTRAERDRIEEAARVNRQKPADFARDALVTAADDCLDSTA